MNIQSRSIFHLGVRIDGVLCLILLVSFAKRSQTLSSSFFEKWFKEYFEIAKNNIRNVYGIADPNSLYMSYINKTTHNNADPDIKADPNKATQYFFS